MVYTIGGDRVAPKQDDPLEAIIVQFPEQPKKISFDLLLVQHLGNFGRYANVNSSRKLGKFSK